MTSYGLIFKLLIGLWILHFTSDVFPGAIIPFAFTVSFLVIDILGGFKKDKELIASKIQELDGEIDSDEEGLSERQIDFRRKMEEGKQLPDAVDARIFATDKDGNESSIIIKVNGEIEVEGNPPEDLIEAAKRLKDSVEQFGPEVVAEEIKRQLEEAENEKD